MLRKSLMIFVLISALWGQTTCMNIQQPWHKKLYNFIKKPKTLWATCIAGIGLYGYCNPSKSIEAFDWVQKNVRSTPPFITGIAFAFSSLFLYSLWRRNNDKVVQQRPLENTELRNYIERFAFRLTNIENILEIDILEKDEKKPTVIDAIVDTLTANHNEFIGINRKIEALEEQLDPLAQDVENIKDLVFEPTNSGNNEGISEIPTEWRIEGKQPGQSEY